MHSVFISILVDCLTNNICLSWCHWKKICLSGYIWLCVAEAAEFWVSFVIWTAIRHLTLYNTEGAVSFKFIVNIGLIWVRSFINNTFYAMPGKHWKEHMKSSEESVMAFPRHALLPTAGLLIPELYFYIWVRATWHR